MHKEIFKKAGLTNEQADILTVLLKNTELKASQIASKTKSTRNAIYYHLKELEKIQLIEKITLKNKASVYKIEHPSNIKNFLDEKEKEYKQNQIFFQNNYHELLSAYHITNNKPGVRFYDNAKLHQQILKAIISNNKGILKILNNGSEKIKTSEGRSYIDKNIKHRIKNKIWARIIFPLDNKNFINTIYKKYNYEYTKVRYVDIDPKKTFSTINIYNNLVSLSTNKIGVIIEDEIIKNTIEELFNNLWRNGKE